MRSKTVLVGIAVLFGVALLWWGIPAYITTTQSIDATNFDQFISGMKVVAVATVAIVLGALLIAKSLFSKHGVLSG